MAKAVHLLQVAAYCDGLTMVHPLDLLLLKHVLWQDPQHVEKIYEWLLKQVSSDFGSSQLESLFHTLFLRMCES
jgi:MoxR-like ATPase